MLIGDEVFADYPFDASAARGVGAGRRRRPSSAVSVACRRLSGCHRSSSAWIGFGGPRRNLADVMAAYELIADTYLIGLDAGAGGACLICSSAVPTCARRSMQRVRPT